MENSLLTEKDIGTYEIEIEFLDQKDKKIFGAGVKTTLDIKAPKQAPKEALPKSEKTKSLVVNDKDTTK